MRTAVTPRPAASPGSVPVIAPGSTPSSRSKSATAPRPALRIKYRTGPGRERSTPAAGAPDASNAEHPSPPACPGARATSRPGPRPRPSQTQTFSDQRASRRRGAPTDPAAPTPPARRRWPRSRTPFRSGSPPARLRAPPPRLRRSTPLPQPPAVGPESEVCTVLYRSIRGPRPAFNPARGSIQPPALDRASTASRRRFKATHALRPGSSPVSPGKYASTAGRNPTGVFSRARRTAWNPTAARPSEVPHRHPRQRHFYAHGQLRRGHPGPGPRTPADSASPEPSGSAPTAGGPHRPS